MQFRTLQAFLANSSTLKIVNAPMQSAGLQASLADLVIVDYEGGRDLENRFDGHGIATFEGGPTYAGDFRGGLMDGNGVYKWTDGTTFTGEFRRNTITGRGKYTWPDGSTYVGEVLNGLRHGCGTMHGPIDGTPRYNGDWYNGERHGLGTLCYDAAGDSRYEGDWANNDRNGHGIMYYASGNIYEGDWVRNVKHGFGKMLWRDRSERYEGEWENDRQNGTGEHTWMQRSQESSWPGTQRQMCNRYHGQWKAGQRHGIGTFHYANGACYSGHWIQGVKDGHGVFVRDDGALYGGNFSCDRMTQDMPRCVLDSGGTHSVEPRVHLHLGDLINCDPFLGKWEETQLQKKILRFNSELKGIYLRYVPHRNGDEEMDEVFAMTTDTFLQFCEDIKISPSRLSRAYVRSVLQNMFRQHSCVIASARLHHQKQNPEELLPDQPVPISYCGKDSLHASKLAPKCRMLDRPILYREFVEAIVRISFATIFRQSVNTSIPEAFDLFMVSTMCPLYQHVAEKHVDGKVPKHQPEIITPLSGMLDALASPLDTISIRPAMTLALALLCGQAKPPGRVSKALCDSVIRDTLGALDRISQPTMTLKNMSFVSALFLSNFELTISELNDFLTELGLRVKGDAIMTQLPAAIQFATSQENTRSSHSSRCVSAISSLCYYC